MKRLALLLFCLWPTAGMATIRYASSTGTDGATGTLANPWSISTACSSSVLIYGDTVYLRGGIYPAEANFSSVTLCTMEPQQNGVYYRSRPGEWAQVQGGKVQSPNIQAVNASASDNITFDSIGLMYGSDWVIYVGSSRQWTLRHCRIDSGAYNCDVGNNEGGIGQALAYDFMTKWLIDSCEFKGNCGRGSIHVYGMESTEVRYCFFDGNHGTEADIYIKSGDQAYGDNAYNEWHHNIFNLVDGGDPPAACGWTARYHVWENRIHHNISYGTSSSEHYTVNKTYGVEISVDAHRNYVYNNTIDLTQGDEGIRSVIGAYGANYHNDSLYIFNNLIFRAADAGAGGSISNFNSKWNASDIGNNPFGVRWYSDYNGFVMRTASDDIYAWYTAGGALNEWTLSEWRTIGPSLTNGSTFTVDPNSISFSDSSNVFVDRGNHNYALDPAGANYTKLSTGGRGGAWPTYIGALGQSAPDNTAPVIWAETATNITGCAAIITWNTDEPATSRVEYDTTTAYSHLTPVNASTVTSHVYPITGLSQNTTYHYKVISQDPSSNQSIGQDQTFKTLDGPCNAALGILPTVSDTYAGFTVAAATDGVVNAQGYTATNWASTDVATIPHWIEVNFGASQQIENVTIHWGWNSGLSSFMTSAQYIIQSWNGSGYTDVATVSNPVFNRDKTVSNIPPTNTQRIRIYQPAGSGPSTYAGIMWLTELQLFDSPASDSTAPDPIVDVH